MDLCSSKWIKLVQTWSKLIKLFQAGLDLFKFDQIGSKWIDVVKNDQICLDLIKLDYNGLNWPEMPFWPKMPFLSESKRFLPDMAICKEVAFRPEMAMNQNWTNQLHFGQNGFLDRFFFARNVFLPEIAVQQKMPLGQKYSFQIWSGFLARSDFLSRNVFLTNLIKKANFSKYWKVWLAFDGWKLSGLLLTKFTRQIIGVRKKKYLLARIRL